MILVGHESFCTYSTIQAAVDEAERSAKPSETIVILPGTYLERLVIRQSNLTLQGIGNVRIVGSAKATDLDEQGDPLGTFRTATVLISGENCSIKNVIIENEAGYGCEVGQALALYADTDESTFEDCTFLGYQDTLFTGALPEWQKDGTPFLVPMDVKKKEQYRQIYRRCTIAGSIDFIFGGAEALFEQCILHSRKEPNRAGGYITAASTPKDQKKGFQFVNCWLTAEQDVHDVYLGRPWRSYARTSFVHCSFGNHIHEAGWHDWGNAEAQQTSTYEVTLLKEQQSMFATGVSWATWQLAPIDKDREI